MVGAQFMWISQQNHSQNMEHMRGLVWVVMVTDNRTFVAVRTHARTRFLYILCEPPQSRAFCETNPNYCLATCRGTAPVGLNHHPPTPTQFERWAILGWKLDECVRFHL